MRTLCCAVIIVLSATGSAVGAAEYIESLSAPARAAIEKDFPDATLVKGKTKVKNGTRIYEMNWKDALSASSTFKVVLLENGIIQEESRHVVKTLLVPKIVRMAQVKWAPLAGEKVWMREHRNEQKRYSVELKTVVQGGKARTFKAEFAKDGALLKGDKIPKEVLVAQIEPVVVRKPVKEPEQSASETPKPKDNEGAELGSKTDDGATGAKVHPETLRKVRRLIRGTLKEDEEDRLKAWSGIKDMGNLAVPGLLELYRSKSTTSRMARSILTAFSESKDPRAGPALLEVLDGKEHQDPLLLRDAARAIEDSNFKGALPSLVRHASDEKQDEEVRLFCARAAAKLGAPEGLVQLAQVLKSADAGTRSRAVFAIGRYGAEPQVAILASALKDKDRDVREDAVEGLRRIGTRLKGGARESVYGPLVRALADTDYKVRNGAMDILRSMTKQKFEDPKEWREWWAKKSTSEKQP